MSEGSRPMPNGTRCERKKCAAVKVCSWAWTCAYRYCPALGKHSNFVVHKAAMAESAEKEERR